MTRSVGHEWPIFHYITWFVPFLLSLFHVCSTTLFPIVPRAINLELKDKYWNCGRGHFPGFLHENETIWAGNTIFQGFLFKNVEIAPLIYNRPPSKSKISGHQSRFDKYFEQKIKRKLPLNPHKIRNEFSSPIDRLRVHSKCYCYMSNMMSNLRAAIMKVSLLQIRGLRLLNLMWKWKQTDV